MQKEEEMQSIQAKKIARPSIFWMVTEVARAATELGLSIPYQKIFAHKNVGDGHPVLVIPGFMATDKSTWPLRNFVQELGYTAYSWDLGRNIAKVKFFDLLEARINVLYKEHQEPITLIGWSLGGIFARQMAKTNPEKIRQVITMGSPFKGIDQANNVAWVYNLLVSKKLIKETAPELFDDFPNPAPVPTTAIYSKEDGIVPWQLCMEVEDAIHQNIQVRGSHLGLGVNPSVWEIIEDRLQYTAADWCYFEPKNMVKDLLYYPSL